MQDTTVVAELDHVVRLHFHELEPGKSPDRRARVRLHSCGSRALQLIYTAFNVRFRRAFISILTCQLNYFSQKRKGNNHYVFVATNNQQQIPAERTQYFFPSRQFAMERRSKRKNYT